MIDPRTNTRYATIEERGIAAVAIQDLEENFLQVKLVPAPFPHFSGHMVREAERRNPEWYQAFVAGRWHTAKRHRVIRALTRVVQKGTVRGNGIERDLLEFLKRRMR